MAYLDPAGGALREMAAAQADSEAVALLAAIPTAAVADVAASNAAAVVGTIPAGGTGAAAGGWDTSGHRDTAIATVTETIATVNALVTEVTELKSKLNSALARLRTAGILTP